MNDVEHVLVTGDELGEGPLWHVEEQRLYWVDIEGHRFHILNPSTGAHEVYPVGMPVGALAFRKSGGLVLATRDGFKFWDMERQSLTDVGDPEADRPEARFNDGAVDRGGRFWAGTLGREFDNNLYRLDPDGSIHHMLGGVDISNGIGWSPDNRTMYYTDSSTKIIYAFDFDVATGSISNQRDFIDTTEMEGTPDGLTVDSDGFIWSARWGGSCVHRFDPAGELERTIRVPVLHVTSCIFGGPDLKTLYITTAKMLLNADERAANPRAGDLFSVRTDVAGLPEPAFAG